MDTMISQFAQDMNDCWWFTSFLLVKSFFGMGMVCHCAKEVVKGFLHGRKHNNA